MQLTLAIRFYSDNALRIDKLGTVLGVLVQVSFDGLRRISSTGFQLLVSIMYKNEMQIRSREGQMTAA
jgi:hypothetical protein